MTTPYTPLNWQDSPSKATPISAANFNHMDAGIAAAALALVPTVVQTTTVTSVSGQLVQANASGGSFVVTLPAAVAGAVVAVKKVDADTSVNVVTVAPVGSDTISGDTALQVRGQVVTYTALAGQWVASSGVVPGGTFRPLRFRNVNATTLPAWRKALARVRAGAGDAKLLCVGDSTTAGVGSGTPFTNQGLPTSYPYRLAAILGGYIPAATGLGIPESALSVNADSRWTVGSGWSAITTLAWGAAADYQGVAPTAGNLVYADTTVVADRFDVYYLTNSGLGTLNLTATGTSAVVVNTGATGISVSKVTLLAATAATTNTVTITGSGSGNVHVVGVEPWLSTTSKVRVGNAGVGSSTTTGWVAKATNDFGAIPCIKAYAPDLTIISLGINDAGASPSLPTATYLTNLQTLITAARTTGDCIVMPPIPGTSAIPAAQATAESAYGAALSGLNGPYADLFARYGTPGSADAYWHADQSHLTASGYADLAAFLSSDLVQV